MTPVADAVRFVDRDQVQLELAERAPNGCLEAFRGAVQELVAPGAQFGDAGSSLVRGERGIQVRGADADLGHRVDLILHQRDQR